MLITLSSRLPDRDSCHICPAVPLAAPPLGRRWGWLMGWMLGWMLGWMKGWMKGWQPQAQAREAEQKRQLGEAWQYHLVGAASHRQLLPRRKGEKRTESREIKHSLSLLLTGIILYYSAICLVTATASAVQKSYKQPYGTSE